MKAGFTMRNKKNKIKKSRATNVSGKMPISLIMRKNTFVTCFIVNVTSSVNF